MIDNLVEEPRAYDYFGCSNRTFSVERRQSLFARRQPLVGKGLERTMFGGPRIHSIFVLKVLRLNMEHYCSFDSTASTTSWALLRHPSRRTGS